MMAKQKHVIGEYWESPGGLGFTITEVADGAVTVEVDRMVRNKDGVRGHEKHTRTIPLGFAFECFSGAYKKQRKKSSE